MGSSMLEVLNTQIVVPRIKSKRAKCSDFTYRAHARNREMHYDPKKGTYKATTINFFLTEKELEFNCDDVSVPDIPGMFTTFHAKGKPLFVEARHFNNPLHYAKLMGYDKPMDFKLGEIEDSENNQK
ncbi:unnamed protein product [Chilo suppressalis]|uniref:Uncharacterized protein n=1 Tax=Chilo suppressalis TaxID=168631 RepID=A0ABN8AQW3_CHISP|nr:unnamed protein product [Chilo suppressalis]